jgi:arsenite methyltransferase
MSDLREEVRQRYAAAARAVPEGMAANDWEAVAGRCDPVDGLGLTLYDASERVQLPDEAVLASLGCGNPTAVADLREGEVVLDLGSGGGIDVLLSARRVGPTGKAYGLDMTDEMLALGRSNAEKAGATNVEFLKGYIEDVPLPDASIDVVISNCVINLSTDKPKVIDEIHRVLRPGGRVGISDVVCDDGMSSEERAARGSYVGCIAGALSFTEYREELSRAGFTDIDVDATHELGIYGGMYGAIVRARKP